MGLLRGLFRFQNPDSTADLNQRLGGLVLKGVLDPGATHPSGAASVTTPVVTRVPGQLAVDVNSFLAIGSDGMFVRHEAPPAERLGLTASTTQYILVKSIYQPAGAPVLEFSVKSVSDWAAVVDKTPYIVLAKVTTGIASVLTDGGIDLTENNLVDKFDRFFIRGVVQSHSMLPTDSPTSVQRVKVGDVYLVIDDRQFWRWDGSAWLTITDQVVAAELATHKGVNGPTTLLTGTASVTNGSAAVTGSGTAFNTQLVIGDKIRFGGDTTIYDVLATPTSTTALTLASNYLGTSGAGKSITKVFLNQQQSGGTIITRDAGDYPAHPAKAVAYAPQAAAPWTSATNVQDAIAEIDLEKVKKTGDTITPGNLTITTTTGGLTSIITSSTSGNAATFSAQLGPYVGMISTGGHTTNASGGAGVNAYGGYVTGTGVGGAGVFALGGDGGGGGRAGTGAIIYGGSSYPGLNLGGFPQAYAGAVITGGSRGTIGYTGAFIYGGTASGGDGGNGNGGAGGIGLTVVGGPGFTANGAIDGSGGTGAQISGGDATGTGDSSGGHGLLVNGGLSTGSGASGPSGIIANGGAGASEAVSNGIGGIGIRTMGGVGGSNGGNPTAIGGAGLMSTGAGLGGIGVIALGTGVTVPFGFPTSASTPGYNAGVYASSTSEAVVGISNGATGAIPSPAPRGGLFVGKGSAVGLYALGGDTSGSGVYGLGGAPNGRGGEFFGTGTGIGVLAQAGPTAGGSVTGIGLLALGRGAAFPILASSGHGVWAIGQTSDAIYAETFSATSRAIFAVNRSTSAGSGVAIYAQGNTPTVGGGGRGIDVYSGSGVGANNSGGTGIVVIAGASGNAGIANGGFGIDIQAGPVTSGAFGNGGTGITVIPGAGRGPGYEGGVGIDVSGSSGADGAKAGPAIRMTGNSDWTTGDSGTFEGYTDVTNSPNISIASANKWQALAFYAGQRQLGTVSALLGSSTLTGSGTFWTSNTSNTSRMKVGSKILFQTHPTATLEVLSIESDTSLTLTAPWPLANESGMLYSIADEFRNMTCTQTYGGRKDFSHFQITHAGFYLISYGVSLFRGAAASAADVLVYTRVVRANEGYATGPVAPFLDIPVVGSYTSFRIGMSNLDGGGTPRVYVTKTCVAYLYAGDKLSVQAACSTAGAFAYEPGLSTALIEAGSSDNVTQDIPSTFSIRRLF